MAMSALHYPRPVGVTAAEQIEYIEAVLGVSDAELGHLFGVRRQAIAGWRKAGMPAERAAGMDRLVELVQFFQRRFVFERIPTIVRTPANGLAGRTMLDVIAREGVQPIFLYLANLAAYRSL